MQFKPLFDRVLAKPIENQIVTKSGISLEAITKIEVKKAKVEKIGEGIFEDGTFVEMKVKEGYIIYYEEHTTVKINLENEDYILIKQTDILGFEE